MLHRMFEFFMFGLAPLVLGMIAMPGPSFAETETLVGEVIYRERIALPPNAKVTVELADVSLADAPASILAEMTVDAAGQVPVKFSLPFDTSVLQKNTQYALQARITVDDKLMFTTQERHAVDLRSIGPQTVLVKMVTQ